jgi:hypothetical protein
LCGGFVAVVVGGMAGGRLKMGNEFRTRLAGGVIQVSFKAVRTGGSKARDGKGQRPYVGQLLSNAG